MFESDKRKPIERDLCFDWQPNSQQASISVIDSQTRQLVHIETRQLTIEMARKLKEMEPHSLFGLTP